ncbi:hypothetical protein SEPCBS119000_004700 [Sporothrix epigloea]|uniref:Uncharacterized protein n=1 Tax=Sporothrix epigloea TaxID=1892477 RepID=A0ABP0DXH3_9PEZI
MVVHICFPRMYVPDPAPSQRRQGKGMSKRARRQTILSADQHKVWYEKILRPGLQLSTRTTQNGVVYDDESFLANFPSSRDSARTFTYAKGESFKRLVNNGSGDKDGENPGHRQIVTRTVYPVALRNLADKWREIIKENPGLVLYSDFRLFFSAKNTKAEWFGPAIPFDQQTVDDRWLQLANEFQAKWDYYFDHEHLNSDDVYLDIAKQSAPVIKREERGRAVSHKEKTFLLRRCCLAKVAEQHRDWITSQLTSPAGAEGEAAAGRRTYRYPSTYYNTVKAPFDAQKHYVFDGENLEALTSRTMLS